MLTRRRQQRRAKVRSRNAFDADSQLARATAQARGTRRVENASRGKRRGGEEMPCLFVALNPLI